ncbi:MAG: hypothetical protein HRJ53_29545 [Acidobacteria bacterium Pan2503]|uniref:Uncharacterized protein n=1 Tax=Candidatus Acidiferrum panamense TaxID=2741543 RepID=A0A7V8NXV5_9BACT|nr:hypothetical protein [Candidatus Acidoferrum panamensis]
MPKGFKGFQKGNGLGRNCFAKGHPRYGGRRPGTMGAKTKSIKLLLNELLPPETLKQHWHYFLYNKDIEVRLRAFRLAIQYMFGRPSSTPLDPDDLPQTDGPQFDTGSIHTRHEPIN